MAEPNDASKKGIIRRIWEFMSRPSARFSVGALIIAGGIGGILLWGGFHRALELSNTEAFCISCHEMRDTVYQELQSTIHWSNRTGVRATCPDCHVPKDWFNKIKRKIAASSELYHKAIGTISTPEKFENKRLELANKTWEFMRSSNSRECQNCHSLASMNPHMQKEAARMKPEAMKAGVTCIDCHRGIAHKLPQEN